MKTEVNAINLNGDKITLPVSELYFRPSSYGVIVNNGKMALVKARHTGRYFFPGGGVDLGETMEEALRREIKEETGLTITDAKLIDANDVFFKYTPDNDSFHSIQFFYLCSVDNPTLMSDDEVQDGEAATPRWVEIESLTPDQFQDHGNDFIARLLAKIKV